MMDAMDDLYQEVIMDHNKRPRNFGTMDDADVQVEGMNPLCGDEITLFVRFDESGEQVESLMFQGHGCAISRSSASIMTELVKGKSKAEAETLFHRFHDLVTRQGEVPDSATLGKMAVFAGVGEYPARVKCASLAWHTLHNALEGKQEPVTTE